MSRLEIIKSAEDDQYQSNVVCEDLKAKLKAIAQPLVTIGKVIQKEGAGKGGYYTWLIWMVQLILEQIVNGTPPAAISPTIASQDALAMTGVKVIMQELPRMNFIRSCWKTL